MPGQFKDWGHGRGGSRADLYNCFSGSCLYTTGTSCQPFPSEMTPVTFISDKPTCLTHPATLILPASCGDVVRQQISGAPRHGRETPRNRNRSPLASSSASSEAVSEQKVRRMRGQKKRKSMDVKAAVQESSTLTSNSTASETLSELRSWKKRGQKKNIWTVDHVEGMKLRMNKRRRPSYRPEDQEAFYRLLEDPVIQSFLEADIFLKVSDKYLLSMVVEYFGRVGLPGHLYNRIHFFLALYIASDMEEDNPTSKRSIFQFLLGREHWPDLYKEFLKLKVEFFHAMGHRAWVTPELCEEIQAQNPHHWVWSRVRQCAP
uniref:Uncharacterized protein n=2 Tax=Canis lupus familiaris TaxID=9615 RepID=A0A8P0NLG7_CANLF